MACKSGTLSTRWDKFNNQIVFQISNTRIFKPSSDKHSLKSQALHSDIGVDYACSYLDSVLTKSAAFSLALVAIATRFLSTASFPTQDCFL